MRKPFDLNKLPASLKRQAQIDRMTDAERSALFPATVEQFGLSEDALGQERFCQSMQERREWIAAYCVHPHCINTIRDDYFRLTGRRFCFKSEDEALAFKMRFG